MIHREERNGIAVLRMEHGKVSALDLEMLREFGDKLAALKREAPPAVILTGTGSSFSAGVDLFRVLNGGKEYLTEFLPALNFALRELYEFPRPVVAAVNGHAIAGGCVIVCACDHRIMAEGTGRIGVTELLVGVPFPALPFQIIRSAVAPQHLQTVVYTGCTYLAAGALGVGLVDEVAAADSLMERACAAATRLAGISSRAFGITKSQLRGYGGDVESAVSETWASPETRAAIEGYLQRTVRKK